MSNAKNSTIVFNNYTINYKDIESFTVSNRSENDNKNKLRENIIASIINNKIPDHFYNTSNNWKNNTCEEADKAALREKCQEAVNTSWNETNNNCECDKLHQQWNGENCSDLALNIKRNYLIKAFLIFLKMRW